MPTATRSSRVRLAVGVLSAVAAGSLASSAGVSAAPPAPREIAGDHHSPSVAGLATQALAAYDAYQASANTTRLIRYIGQRNAAADAVAAEFGLDPLTVRESWVRAGHQHQVAVLAALSQLGVSYVSNSSEPGVAFDCSGLTAYAWGRAGVELYRQSGVQLANAAQRDHDSAVAGDIVGYPGHVMMYLGVGDAMVHAANPEADVELSTLNDSSYGWGDPTG
jgi:cell wall-associated NlpC family hydrolase